MTTRKMIEPRIVKLTFSGVVCVWRSANVQPAMPASAADSPKVTVLTTATCTPMTDAAVVLSRTAIIARPMRLFTRLRTRT